MWREMLDGYGVTDVASLVFRSRYGCWGFLDLWRIGGVAFSVADAEFLTAIAKDVTDALRRCQAGTFTRSVRHASAPRHRVPGRTSR